MQLDLNKIFRDKSSFEKLLGSFLLLNSDFKIVFISDESLNIFGKEFSRYLNLYLYDIAPELSKKNLSNIVDKDLIEVSFRNLDESSFANLSIYSVENNESVKYIAKIEDLSELNFYKQRIGRWEHRYKLLIDESNQLFFSIRLSDKKCRWGYYQKEVLGSKFDSDSDFDELYSKVHKKFEKEFKEKIKSAFEQGLRIDYEFMFLVDNNYQWRRIIAKNASINDAEPQLYGIIENIHHQKQKEFNDEQSKNSFKKVLDDINEVFYRTDKDGIIKLISKAVERLLKYKVDSLIDKHVENLYFNPKDRAKLIENLEKFGFVENYNLNLKSYDGNEVYISLNARYYYGVDGEFLGTEGMFFNVGEKRKVELEKLKLLNEFKNSLRGVNVQLFRLRKKNNEFVVVFNEGKLARDLKVKNNKKSEEKIDNVFKYNLTNDEKACINNAFKGETSSFTNLVDEKYLKTTISPFNKNKKGEVNEIIGVVYDITESVLTNRQLAESEDKYKTFVEEANDGIVIMQDGKYVFVNKSFAKMTGYNSPSEIHGKSIKDFVPDNSSETIERNHRNRMENEKSVPQIYEIDVKRKDGSHFPAELNNAVVTFNNRTAGLTFVRDLTEKKKDEKKLMANIERNNILLESFPLMYIVADSNFKILNFNIPETSNMHEFEAALSKSEDIFCLSFNSNHLDNIAKSITKCLKGEDIAISEIRYKSNGKVKIVHLRYVKLDDNEVLLAFDNVTEQYEYEAKLVKEKERAQESDRLKSAFLANMSHEIRTPMNAIIGFSEMLKYPDITGEERNEFVQIINNRSKDLLNLINDIIDVSKIEAGSFSFAMDSVDLKNLVNEVFNSFKSESKIINNQIEYKLNYFVIPDDVKIKTDKGKLKQLLSNLINNAIKFTQKGKVEVRVFNKNAVVIYDVIDTGIGIEEQNQKIIFDRFIQVEMNADRPFEGAGIGLTISKAIVDKLNGKISVKSKVGKGSVFRVEIPIK